MPETLAPQTILEALRRLERGDFTGLLPTDADDPVSREIAETYNRHLSRMNQFAAELTHVARDHSRDGRLGGQIEVPGAEGTWQDLITNVNAMSETLVTQLRDLFGQVSALAEGRLVRTAASGTGEIGECQRTLNGFTERMERLTAEVYRITREIGREGMLGGQAVVPDATGVWRDVADGLNTMAANLTDYVRALALHTTRVASGDLSQRMATGAKGELIELEMTVNVMADQLALMMAEFERITREIGTEGRFGGQAEVRGTSGAWAELVANLNRMSANLTNQIRDLNQTAKAAASGGPLRPLTCGRQGEMDNLFEHVGALSQRAAASAQP